MHTVSVLRLNHEYLQYAFFQEWEDFSKKDTDGRVKKYRRRFYVMKPVKVPSPESADPVKYEEVEIDENTDASEEKFEPQVCMIIFLSPL